MRKQLLLLSALTMASACAIAQEFKALDGQYAISSKTFLDPPPKEKKDRVLFSMHGNSAKEIFDSMDAPAKKDKCSANLVTKSAGSLECSKSATGVYQCTFGVLLNSGATTKGRIC